MTDTPFQPGDVVQMRAGSGRSGDLGVVVERITTRRAYLVDWYLDPNWVTAWYQGQANLVRCDGSVPAPVATRAMAAALGGGLETSCNQSNESS